MAVTIKTELRPVGPSMTNRPEHGFSSEFIEAIRRINE
jgi:hypothetical protein